MNHRIPRPARHISEQWRLLESQRSKGKLFDPRDVEHRPPAARRWIVHAISAGTPVARGVRLSMKGSIKIGTWRPFTATELLVPDIGFIWAATAKVAGIPVAGYDRFLGGSGEMRWRLGGVIPVMSAQGNDVSLSAVGRLVGESIFLPTTYTSAGWTDLTTGTTRMSRVIDSHDESVDLDIAEDGALRCARMQRWGNPTGTGFSRRLFTVSITAEQTFGGITIPSRFATAWGHADDEELFRAEIVHAEFQ